MKIPVWLKTVYSHCNIKFINSVQLRKFIRFITLNFIYLKAILGILLLIRLTTPLTYMRYPWWTNSHIYDPGLETSCLYVLQTCFGNSYVRYLQGRLIDGTDFIWENYLYFFVCFGFLSACTVRRKNIRMIAVFQV